MKSLFLTFICVSHPLDAGNVTLNARNCGSVYMVERGPSAPSVAMLDPDPDHPSASFGPNHTVIWPKDANFSHQHREVKPHSRVGDDTSTTGSPIGNRSYKSSQPSGHADPVTVELLDTQTSVNALYSRPGEDGVLRYAFGARVTSPGWHTFPSSPLVVRYNITGGTALLGTDYSGVTQEGTVTIRPGWPGWGAVYATAIDNANANSTRTICVELLPGAGCVACNSHYTNVFPTQILASIVSPPCQSTSVSQ